MFNGIAFNGIVFSGIAFSGIALIKLLIECQDKT